MQASRVDAQVLDAGTETDGSITCSSQTKKSGELEVQIGHSGNGSYHTVSGVRKD